MTTKNIYIVSGILPQTIEVTNFNMAMVWSLLWAILLVGGSVFIAWALSKVMQKRGMKTSHTTAIAIAGVFSLALFAKYGVSVTAVQGIFLLFVLLYASCSDLTSHTVDDFVWVTVLALALVGMNHIGIGSMLLGAACVFIPQIALSLLPPHKTLGGADIKLSTALAFLLGVWRGIGAYLIGLILALIVMSIYSKCTNRCKRKPFALVPFLSIGAMLMFLI